MSGKQTKRYRKEVRRRVDDNLGVGLEALNKITRKRPSFISKKIWILFYLPLFKRKYLGIISKNID